MRRPRRPKRAPGRSRKGTDPARSQGSDVRRIDHPRPQVELPATYTLADIARRIQCSRRHVATLRALGKLPAHIAGLLPLLRFERSSVDQWIASGCMAQGEAQR